MTEILIGRYAGNTWTDNGKTVAVSGLRQLATKQWPDIRLPTEIVLLPREDFDIMSADLNGQIYTPHRRAIAVCVTLAEPKPPSNPIWEWVQAFFWVAVLLLSLNGLGAVLDK